MVERSREYASSNLKINPQILQEFHKILVEKTLASLEFSTKDKTKALYIDHDVGILLDLIGVKLKNSFDDLITLEAGCFLDTKCFNVVYLSKPTIETCKIVESHINDNIKKKGDHEFFLIFVPSYTVICKKILENSGILKFLNVGEMRLDFTFIEDDIISLEDKFSFQNLILYNDYSILSQLVRVINKIESIYGLIKNKYSKGEWSCLLFEKLNKVAEKKKYSNDSEINYMIILDRTIDLYTPLCMQMTYEGQIDEYLNLKSTLLQTEIENDDESKSSSKLLKILNNKDVIFKEIRDRLLGQLNTFFPKKVQMIQKVFAEKDLHKRTTEITEYLEKINNMKLAQQRTSIPDHVNIGSKLFKIASSFLYNIFHELEMSIMLNDSLTMSSELLTNLCTELKQRNSIIRLFLLLNLTQTIPLTSYQELVKIIIDAFGVEEIVRIANMEKIGILKSQEKSSWPEIKKNL